MSFFTSHLSDWDQSDKYHQVWHDNLFKWGQVPSWSEVKHLHLLHREFVQPSFHLMESWNGLDWRGTWSSSSSMGRELFTLPGYSTHPVSPTSLFYCSVCSSPSPGNAGGRNPCCLKNWTFPFQNPTRIFRPGKISVELPWVTVGLSPYLSAVFSMPSLPLPSFTSPIKVAMHGK